MAVWPARLALDNSKAFQAAAVFRQGSSLLIAVLLAQSLLSKAEIGLYEQLLYVGFAATSFWISGLMQALLARYPQLPKARRAPFLFSAHLLVLGLGGLAIAGLWWGQPWVLPALTGLPSLPYFGLFLIYLWLNLSSFLLEHFYLLWERPRELFAFSALSNGLQVLAIMLPIWGGLDLEAALQALAVLAAARQLWLWAALARFGKAGIDGVALWQWLVLALPLVLYAIVGTISVAFDSWLVNFHYEGDQEMFAIFRYGARELPLAVALAAALGTAMLPEVAADLPSALEKLKRRSRQLFHLLFPFSMLLMLSSWWWFPLVFSVDFAASTGIFNIFLLIVISRLLFPRTLLIGLNANRQVLYFSLLELAFNIVLGLLLVQFMGLAGIAWATVLAYTLEKIMLCAYLKARFGIAMAEYVDVGWFSLYSGALVVCYMLASMNI